MNKKEGKTVVFSISCLVPSELTYNVELYRKVYTSQCEIQYNYNVYKIYYVILKSIHNEKQSIMTRQFLSILISNYNSELKSRKNLLKSQSHFYIFYNS